MMASVCGWSGANAVNLRSEFFSGAALRGPACRSSPGGASVEIHQTLTRSNRVSSIFCRHEQGEFFAVEGYAKSSGRGGVCIAIQTMLDTQSPISSQIVASIARRLQRKGHLKGQRGNELLATRAETGRDAAGSGYTRSMLAVFLSGGGSNFRALHTACLNNSIYGDVAVVVSDKPGCKGCDYAREHKLPVLTYPLSKHAQDGLSAADLIAALRNYGVDYIVLAGYLKLLPAELVQAYPRSILNIHPALLPSFGGKGLYGMKVHEAVIKSGARFSGATVHFVDENFDTGPILAQRIVPVLSDDTAQDLAAKVLKVEHLLYSEAVAALCEDRIFWRDDGVPLIRKAWNEAEYY